MKMKNKITYDKQVLLENQLPHNNKFTFSVNTKHEDECI